MGSRGVFGICPVCKAQGRISRKWTINKYGKKYQYTIYEHYDQSHYIRQDQNLRRMIKKGEIERALMEIINSQDFKLGLFRVSDIMDRVRMHYPNIGYCSIKNNLEKLVQIGMIEARKEGRNLYFVNTVSREKLSFVIKAMHIMLEDLEDNRMLSKHTFLIKILNNHSWPLYYIPFRAVGDVNIKFEDLQFRASDPNSNESYAVIVIEDNPTDKRVLIKLRKPLLPYETSNIKLEYVWNESNRLYTHSSGTEMESFKFTLASNYNIKVSALMTSLTGNISLDISDKFRIEDDVKWKHLKTLSLSDVKPFSMFQFRWQLD